MGKIAIWVLVIVAGLLLYRLIGQVRKPSRRDDVPAKPAEDGDADGPAMTGRGRGTRATADELIMACSVCGVHVPSSEAVFARGRVYCGPTHRDADPAGKD